ncbi:MAG TPA: transketolase [Solirubrobacteraceae bacterium]|nr:transketolase [Solirubrobacteraceae bacterium]
MNGPATPETVVAVDEARRIAEVVRRTVIEQSKRANVGHIGSALSIAEILGALFGGPLAGVDPDSPERDRFVLSKGHAALALYGALHARGWLTSEQLDSFCADGTELVGHPEHLLRCVDFSTGSLGQGMPLATGAALAARLQGSPRRVYALLSDAEMNEGSVWEAAMFAAHHGLANLTVVIDVNGQQALGYTRDVIDLEPLAQRWRSFNWDVHELDGHDLQQLVSTLAALPGGAKQPHMILARTTFGKGVSFMESRIEWHYLPMSDEEYTTALTGLSEGGG